MMKHTTNTTRNTRTNNSRRTGGMIIYMSFALVAFAGMVSIGVEWGMVQVVKTELQATADSAARAGATSLAVGPSNAFKQTKAIGALNKAYGSTVDLVNNDDIQLVKWDTKTLTYTVLSGQNQLNANAVRVVARRDDSRGTAVKLPFTAILKKDRQNVKAESIAMLIPLISVNESVRAQANPFLSGAKKGTVASPINPHNNPDYAGDANDLRASPTAVKGLGGQLEGIALNFDSIEGTARHDPNLPYFNPDGELVEIGHNNVTTDHNASKYSRMFNENGIADAWIPINSLVGVFLDDSDPSSTPAPANLDFRADASREFAELKPQLKQVFFIGDGMDNE